MSVSTVQSIHLIVQFTFATCKCLQSAPLDLIDTGKGLKVQTATPHLVSLGSGRLSVAITLLPLKEGNAQGNVIR